MRAPQLRRTIEVCMDFMGADPRGLLAAVIGQVSTASSWPPRRTSDSGLIGRRVQSAPRRALACLAARPYPVTRRPGTARGATGEPARVPVDDTDLGGAPVAATGMTVLSVADVRRLCELAATTAARGRGR